MRSFFRSPLAVKIYNIASIIIFLLVGSALLVESRRLASLEQLLTLLALSVYTLQGLRRLISRHWLIYLAELLLNVGLIVFLLRHPAYISILISRVVGCYYALLGTVHLAVARQYRNNGVSGMLDIVLLMLVEYTIAFGLIVKPSQNLGSLRFFMGLYFVFYALSLLYEMLIDFVPRKTKPRRLRRLRISLPNIFSVFIPVRVLRTINKALTKKQFTPQQLEEKKENEPTELAVFIHMTDTFPGQMGHVDICFGNTVMSYGNYDESSYRLKGLIGDGVVEVIEKQPYIDFCLSYSKKTIVGFGIKITPQQKETVYAKVTSIFDNLIPWSPPALAEERHILRSARYANDYASALFRATNASFFKFRHGEYARYCTYFSMFTNCAKMADEILGSLGFDALDPVGIITPGTYFDFFNTEFMKRSSPVVSRTIYSGQLAAENDMRD